MTGEMLQRGQGLRDCEENQRQAAALIQFPGMQDFIAQE